jgi:hypothetical protein
MSTINTNNSGIVFTGNTDGTLDLATGGTTRMTIDGSGNVSIAAGNLAFTGTAQRITGDMSNATASNRLAFQSSTTNGNTNIEILPNGTATRSDLLLNNSSDPANSSLAQVFISNTEMRILSSQRGTGSALPMTFYTGGSERVRIDTSGNVGIGTNAPSGNFQVSAANVRVRFSNTAATASTFAFGADSSLVWLGSETNADFYFITNNTEKMRIKAGGEVYIAGTNDQGTYNLQVNGTGVWGAGAYVNGSDARLKDDITTLNDGLNVVSQLRPVTFKYKPDYSKDQNVQTGFIAQELQAALEGKDYLDGIVQAGPNHLNVAYQSLIPILTKAIQELTARVAELEAK